LTHPKWRFSDKKWKEAHGRSLARIKNPRIDTKHLRKTTDPTPAKAPKRIAARFYQLKSGRVRPYGYSPEVDQLREDDQCWWCCRLGQAWEHLFKHCTRWRAQQKAMWAKVEKDTQRGKRKWKMAELFADERCNEAILEFLQTTGVGRNVPVEMAETESTESGAEQECPRGECISHMVHFPTSNFPNPYFCLAGSGAASDWLVARFPPWRTG